MKSSNRIFDSYYSVYWSTWAVTFWSFFSLSLSSPLAGIDFLSLLFDVTSIGISFLSLFSLIYIFLSFSFYIFPVLKCYVRYNIHSSFFLPLCLSCICLYVCLSLTFIDVLSLSLSALICLCLSLSVRCWSVYRFSFRDKARETLGRRVLLNPYIQYN